MGFDHDIFISYAHLDNLRPDPEETGWVTALHRDLEIRVAQLMGRKDLRVWRDPKLEGNDFFADALIDRLPRVATLVCVISPTYLSSEWCRKELLGFWNAAHGGGLPESRKSRVFKVIKTPMRLEAQPPELQKLLGFDFYRVDPDTERPIELDLGVDPDAKRDYWARVNDLAHALSERIGVLVSGNGGGGARAKGSVFLAETTSDQRAVRDQIRRDLLHNDYRVLPERPLPQVAAELTEFVRGQLEGCLLSVHLIGRRYGVVPEGSDDSLVALQSSIAGERCGADALHRLLWLPEDLAPEDDRQREFLDKLKDDEATYVNGDLLSVPLEDLKTEVHEQLDAARRVAAAAPREKEAGRRIEIYLICDRQDIDHTGALEDCLYDRGYEVILPVFEGDDPDPKTFHRDNLAQCDAFVVYYGHGSEQWVRSQLRELDRIRDVEGGTPTLGTGVLVAPPMNPRKERFRTHQALLMRQRGEFDTSIVEPFLKAIEDA